jgi:hypothetical protein
MQNNSEDRTRSVRKLDYSRTCWESVGWGIRREDIGLYFSARELACDYLLRHCLLTPASFGDKFAGLDRRITAYRDEPVQDRRMIC